MSDAVTIHSARSLFAAMRARERGGCTSICLDDSLKFTPGNGGGDVRFPTGVLARYLEHKHGIPEAILTEEYDDVFAEEGEEGGPILSPTHPIRILWTVDSGVPTSRAWVVPCEDLQSSAGSMDTSVATADPLVDDLRNVTRELTAISWRLADYEDKIGQMERKLDEYEQKRKESEDNAEKSLDIKMEILGSDVGSMLVDTAHDVVNRVTRRMAGDEGFANRVASRVAVKLAVTNPGFFGSTTAASSAYTAGMVRGRTRYSSGSSSLHTLPLTPTTPPMASPSTPGASPTTNLIL